MSPAGWLARVFAALGLSSCDPSDVEVERSRVRLVYSAVVGVVETDSESVEVGPEAPASLTPGDGEGRLLFTAGSTTIGLPDVFGADVYLDPFTRAAGLRPVGKTTWRVQAETLADQPVAAVVVAGDLSWPASVEVRDGETYLEAYGDGSGSRWVAVWSRGGRAVSLATEAISERDPERVLTRSHLPRGQVTLAVDTLAEAWVEVLPVIDGVLARVPLAAGRVSRTRALVAPADWEGGIGLAAHLRVRAVGRLSAEVDQLFHLEPGARSAFLPLPTLPPMGPEPTERPEDARPLGAAPRAMAWQAPSGVAFWGAAFSDPEGCVPGRHWSFSPQAEDSLALPERLGDLAVVEASVLGVTLPDHPAAWEAGDGAKPPLSEWMSLSGRSGYVRAQVAECEDTSGPTGRFALVAAADSPCAQGAIRAALVADRCGRVSLRPQSPGADIPEFLRCGRWSDGRFTDATGQAFRVRSVQDPSLGAVWQIDHPTGAWRLVPERDVPMQGAALPPESVGQFSAIEVESHLERPEFPGEAMLGSSRAEYSGPEGEGPYLSLTAAGRLHAAWPGTELVGRLTASPGQGRHLGLILDPQICETRNVADHLTLTTDGGGAVLRLHANGPMVLDRPSLRVVTATFSR